MKKLFSTIRSVLLYFGSLIKSRQILFISVYIVLLLFPLLKSGYYSDDLMTSTVYSKFRLQSLPFTSYYLESVKSTVTRSGRLIVLNPSALIFLGNSNVFVYKSIVLVLIILNILLLGTVVKQATGDNSLALMSMIITPLLFQFRLNHDPILSFYGFQQFLILYILGSAYFLQHYLRFNKFKYLALSVFLFNLLLYSYELGAVFIVLYVMLIYLSNRPIKIKLRMSSGYVISFVVYIILAYYFRTHQLAVVRYQGTMMSFDLERMIVAFLNQLSSAFPLSYYLSKDNQLFCHTVPCVLQSMNIRIISALVLMNVLVLNTTTGKSNKLNLNSILYVGLHLLVLPAVLISFSKKYQIELSSFVFGIGYIFTYIQYFGLVLIVAYFISRLRDYMNFRLVLCIICSFILILTLQANEIVIKKANIDIYSHYRLLADTLQHKGILRNVPEKSALLILDFYRYDPYHFNSVLQGWVHGYEWKNRYFVYQYGQKDMEIYEKPGDFFRSPNLSKYIIIMKNIESFAWCEVYKMESFSENANGFNVGAKLDISTGPTDSRVIKKIYIKKS